MLVFCKKDTSQKGTSKVQVRYKQGTSRVQAKKDTSTMQVHAKWAVKCKYNASTRQVGSLKGSRKRVVNESWMSRAHSFSNDDAKVRWRNCLLQIFFRKNAKKNAKHFLFLLERHFFLECTLFKIAWIAKLHEHLIW